MPIAWLDLSLGGPVAEDPAQGGSGLESRGPSGPLSPLLLAVVAAGAGLPLRDHRPRDALAPGDGRRLLVAQSPHIRAPRPHHVAREARTRGAFAVRIDHRRPAAERA
jgi:hypothetical protein